MIDNPLKIVSFSYFSTCKTGGFVLITIVINEVHGVWPTIFRF